MVEVSCFNHKMHNGFIMGLNDYTNIRYMLAGQALETR